MATNITTAKQLGNVLRRNDYELNITGDLVSDVETIVLLTT